MKVDYVRISPDEAIECPDEDVEPPATTATLDPAQPGAGGTYTVPVTVNFSATDPSGVEATEYSVDGDDWRSVSNGGGADPFTSSVRLRDEGEHTVRYRSRDAEGNLSGPQEVAFTIADVRDVYAQGGAWDPDALAVDFGETVTWHFDNPEAERPHDLALAAPGTDPGTPTKLDELVMPGDAPVDYTFRKAGAWTFVCTLHSTYDAATSSWTGMVGTVDVGDDPGPGPGPGPVPAPAPAPARAATRPRRPAPARIRCPRCRPRPRPSSASSPRRSWPRSSSAACGSARRASPASGGRSRSGSTSARRASSGSRRPPRSRAARCGARPTTAPP